MVSMLMYSSSIKELRLIREMTEDLAAHLSEEKWEMFSYSSLQEVLDFFEKQSLVDLACYDVTVQGSLDGLGKIRKEHKDMLLMLVADVTLSPMEYVRPDILASSLILRPFTQAALRDKLSDMIRDYLSRVEKGNGEEAFVVATREGKIRIPYNQICYMEARDKKIYIRLRDREIAFYGTIEELEEKLPAIFLRCHRGFLVNRMYVEKIMLSQNVIRLSHGMSVPLSRSYKPQFKELL